MNLEFSLREKLEPHPRHYGELLYELIHAGQDPSANIAGRLKYFLKYLLRRMVPPIYSTIWEKLVDCTVAKLMGDANYETGNSKQIEALAKGAVVAVKQLLDLEEKTTKHN